MTLFPINHCVQKSIGLDPLEHFCPVACTFVLCSNQRAAFGLQQKGENHTVWTEILASAEMQRWLA